MLTEALIIARANPNTHLLIFVRKKEFDPTVETIRPLEKTGCRFVSIGYDEAESFVKMVFQYKHLYNKVKRAIAYKKSGKPLEELDEDLEDATDEEVEKMHDVLGIEDLSHDWLNTIVALDDCGNSGLFRKPDSYFNNRLKLCRDDNAIYLLSIHGITQLSPSIKQNTATVFVFRGLSDERLCVIRRQLNVPLEWEEFRSAYRKMMNTQGKRMLIMDNIAGTTPDVE
jgi:hypothetical protein